MRIFDSVIKTEYNTCVALGFFDGVHIGHKAVLECCKSYGDCDTKTAVLTFKKSPSASLSDIKKPMLTTNARKLGIFESMGIECAFCVDFETVMNLSAEQFVKDILCDSLHAKTVVTGFNYHFGKGGSCNADDLKVLCEKYGIKAIKCESVTYKDAPVSSSRIRECIKNGELEDANAMLGYDFYIDTPITSGNHIGTKINSPTINQKLCDGLVTPKFGVYATRVVVGDKQYVGATNIGVHPTVGECAPVCETHLLNFHDEELKADKIKTYLLHFIREEQKFMSLELLKSQIEEDKKTILTYIK